MRARVERATSAASTTTSPWPALQIENPQPRASVLVVLTDFTTAVDHLQAVLDETPDASHLRRVGAALRVR